TIGKRALPALLKAIKGKNNADIPMAVLLRNLALVVLPAVIFVAAMGLTYKVVTAPIVTVDYGLQEMGGFGSFDDDSDLYGGGLAEPEGAESLQPMGLGFDAADDTTDANAQ